MRCVNKTQVVIGTGALFLGVLLYLISRPLEQTYFGSILEISYKARHWDSRFLNEIGGSLPSFLHVLAFSLLVGGLFGARKTGYLIICLAWLFTNVLFELGQKHITTASQAIPQSFEGVFILENMKSYFLKGTYDHFDILASCAGSAAAYWVLLRTRDERRG